MNQQCYNCSNNFEQNERLYFCPSCLTQVKCKNCSESLSKGAIGCISCGTPLKSTQADQVQLNEIEFEQKGDQKKFKAKFTDNVGQELVSTFGGMIGIPTQKKKPLSIFQSKANIDKHTVDNQQYVEDAEVLDDDDVTEALKQVFKIDGDGLVFQTSNFKSTTTLNKEIRVALLTLLAYKHLHHLEEIKRQRLTDTLKKLKLNSSTFRAWINKSEEIGQKNGGVIFLTINGVESAIAVLKEILTSDIAVGAIDFSKSTGKRRSSRGSEGSDTKRSSSTSPKECINRLIAENFFHEKRGLSDITNHLKVNHAITLKSTDISGLLGKLVTNKILKREKGESKTYVYFV